MSRTDHSASTNHLPSLITATKHAFLVIHLLLSVLEQSNHLEQIPIRLKNTRSIDSAGGYAIKWGKIDPPSLLFRVSLRRINSLLRHIFLSVSRYLSKIAMIDIIKENTLDILSLLRIRPRLPNRRPQVVVVIISHVQRMRHANILHSDNRNITERIN